MISGLLIASGVSKRISGFKPLLDLNGQSFLLVILEKILSVTNNTIIVVGYNYILILEELEKYFNEKIIEIEEGIWQINSNIKVVLNNKYKKGMFTSLKTGVRQLQESDWILYHFIDQPSIPLSFYKDFKSLITTNVNWIQPVFKNQTGHPILFNKNIITRIIKSEDSSNLRVVSSDEKIKKQFWNCNYAQVLEDIDTDEDYKRLIL